MYQTASAQNTPAQGGPTATPASAAVFPDAAASDPIALGWMQGFPPAPDKTIAFTPTCWR